MVDEDEPSFTTVDDLREIERIKVLKARYLSLLDTKQWSGYREVLTDDAEALHDSGDGAPIMVLGRSADDITANISASMADAVSVHHAHSLEIVLISPTAAVGGWVMSDVVYRSAVGEESSSMGWGHYNDRYERGTDGNWKLASFRITRLLTGAAQLSVTVALT